jgi:hypothetical protein
LILRELHLDRGTHEAIAKAVAGKYVSLKSTNQLLEVEASGDLE